MMFAGEAPPTTTTTTTTTKEDLSYGSSYITKRRSYKAIAWDDFAAYAETGDIVLYSGQGLVSSAIKIAEAWSDWSHVGMIVRQAGEAEDGSQDRLMVWESTTADGEVDLISGKRVGGVRLVDAEHAIRRYLLAERDTMVVVRHLYFNKEVLGNQIDPNARLPEFRRFMSQVRNLPYEHHPGEMLRALFRGLQLLTTARSLDSYFCSELVAESYMKLGLLEAPAARSTHSSGPEGVEEWLEEELKLAEQRSASLYTPKDFAFETEDLPFPKFADSNVPVVGLGPNLKVVFPDAGPDPLRTAPPKVPHARRAVLRMKGLV